FLISGFWLQDAHAACENPGGNAREMVYNTPWRVPMYCNGTAWIAAGPKTYNPTAVTFDGSNDYLTRGADLTGNADGTLLTGSFWIRRNSLGTVQYLYDNTNSRIRLHLNASNALEIRGRNDLGTMVFDVLSTTAIDDSDWHHVMFSFDTGQTCVSGTTTGPGC